MDLEAQGQSKDVVLCERCFAMVKVGAEFCPDCGGPMATEDIASEGSDSAIYPELARANLLRMRGEYKQAEEICYSILRRFPNNGTANGLLGDMKAEQGDLEQAAEWYELGLDISPDDANLKSKFDTIRKRIQDREAASTAKSIGLSEAKPKTGMMAGVMIALVLVASAVAYFLGQNSPKSTAKSGTSNLDRPLNIPASQQGESTNTNTAEAPSAITEEDRQLVASLATDNPASKYILYATQDVRSKDIFLTFFTDPETSVRTIAAELAASIFRSRAECQKITLRAVAGGKAIFTADSLRAAFASTDNGEWKQANQSVADALANAILSNEWPPAPVTNTTSGNEPDTPKNQTPPVDSGSETPPTANDPPAGGDSNSQSGGNQNSDGD